MAQEQTSAAKPMSDAEIQAALDIPGVGTETAQNTSTANPVFSNQEKLGEKILNSVTQEEEEEEGGDPDKTSKTTPDPNVDEALNVAGAAANVESSDDDSEQEEEEEEEEEEAGAINPAVKVKGSAFNALNSLIKEGVILPFEGEEDTAKYTEKDWNALLSANLERIREEDKEEIKKELFENISPELQLLAKYELDGGTDIKTQLKKILTVVETKSLDPEKEEDRDVIIRSWLTHTKFGTPEEIEQEIVDIKTSKKDLEKAKQFKPKLDALEEEKLAKEASTREQVNKQKAETYKKYTESVYKVVTAGELEGIKLDKKAQGMIFSGLTESKYQSITGKPTTKLGHLLEKNQVLEPNHVLMAKVMWLLEDPEGFENAVRAKAVVETSAVVKKKLKQAEADSGGESTGAATNTDDVTRSKNKKTLKRPNIFARP